MRPAMRILALLALALAFALPASAQSDRPVDAAALEQARICMDKTGMTGLMRITLNSSAANMRRVLEAANPGKAEAVGEVMTMMIDEFDQRLPLLIEATARVYAQHFNAEELAEIVRFYDTPTGQKLIRELPSILKEAQAIGGRLGQQIGLEVMRKLTPELEKRELKLEPKKI
jgi:hypothetical protein